MPDHKANVIEAFKLAMRQELPNIIETVTVAAVADRANDITSRFATAASIAIRNRTGEKITQDMMDEITREIFDEIVDGVQAIINSFRVARN